MPTVKFPGGKYLTERSVIDPILYITNVMKTDGLYMGCYPSLSACFYDWIDEFITVKKIYHKEEGQQIKHRIVNFKASDLVNYQDADQFGYEVAKRYGDCYQTIYAVHQDTEHIHVHFIINTVSYVDGKRYDIGPWEKSWLEGISESWLAMHESNLSDNKIEKYYSNCKYPY